MTPRRIRDFGNRHDKLLETLAERIVDDAAWPVAPDDWDTAAHLLSQSQPRGETSKLWLLVHPDGRMIDCNASAAAVFGLDGLGDRLHGVGDRLSRSGTATQVVAATDIHGHPVILRATRMPDRLTWQLQGGASPASPDFGAAIVAFWHLTPAEAEIAQALLLGQSSERIASTTGRTIGTVRQVIKSILAKMQVGSQAQAVARLASVAFAYASMNEPSQDVPARIQHLGPSDPSGPMAFWRYGETGGKPVLFFHGALFGIVGRPSVATEARLFGFDVIAPERPGYGETPLPRHADPVAMSVAHAMAILDAEGIDRVQLMAHDVGCVYAFAFARSHPERVTSIICAPATPPMMGWRQTADMPPLHRVSAFAAQKAPAMMEVLVKLGLQRIAREGLSAIPRLVFADSEHDRAVMLRPDAYPVLEQMYRNSSTQDAAGFVQDMFVTNRDWSDWLPAIRCPVLFLHGQKSRTVSENALRITCAKLPDARLVLVPDAGHTLPISHAEHIMRHALLL
jgi:pimeloyl-ACP methyl ester carboxylesterase/DNA-binding CsgD family transcriptional regulator